uniref:Uncharacterized protein n=1 Tax=Anopheles dirus TaxID=7168 RepID=A0A182NJU7_9DIPT
MLLTQQFLQDVVRAKGHVDQQMHQQRKQLKPEHVRQLPFAVLQCEQPAGDEGVRWLPWQRSLQCLVPIGDGFRQDLTEQHVQQYVVPDDGTGQNARDNATAVGSAWSRPSRRWRCRKLSTISSMTMASEDSTRPTMVYQLVQLLRCLVVVIHGLRRPMAQMANSGSSSWTRARDTW